MRATASHHHDATTSPEVRATIAASKDDVSIRISDQGTFVPSPLRSSGGSARMRKSDSNALAAATRRRDTQRKGAFGSVFLFAHPEFCAVG